MPLVELTTSDAHQLRIQPALRNDICAIHSQTAWTAVTSTVPCAVAATVRESPIQFFVAAEHFVQFVVITVTLHCGTSAFKCANNRKCIMRYNLCDGINNCGDRSDETAEACVLRSAPTTTIRPAGGTAYHKNACKICHPKILLSCDSPSRVQD